MEIKDDSLEIQTHEFFPIIDDVKSRNGKKFYIIGENIFYEDALNTIHDVVEKLLHENKLFSTLLQLPKESIPIFYEFVYRSYPHRNLSDGYVHQDNVCWFCPLAVRVSDGKLNTRHVCHLLNDITHGTDNLCTPEDWLKAGLIEVMVYLKNYTPSNLVKKPTLMRRLKNFLNSDM
jgi:hypothetical protein